MIGALNIAQTGLSASKYAVENVANNITNENTPGYKKRVVNFSEINNLSLTAGQGVGYDLARVTSEFLYGNLVTETSKFSYNEEVSQILENAEALFAETEDSGFSANLNRYYQSIENLRSEPNNEIYQTDLASNGKFLVESIQKIYEGIERIQLVKQDELKANIEKVNNILNDIGKLNEQMSNYDKVSIDLLDKRDNLEEELSKYVDIEATNFNNEYELKIAGQTAVRYSTNIRSISLETEQTTQIDRFSFKDNSGTPKDNIKNYIDDAGNIQSQTFQNGDVVKYTFNSKDSVSITIGDTITGTNIYTGSQETITVNQNNLIKAIAMEINSNPQIRSYITAYNGEPKYDSNGVLVEPLQDEYLVINSDKEGLEGKFESRISFETVDSVTLDIERKNIYKGELTSIEASSKSNINIFGSEVALSSGIIKAQLEFIDSESNMNMLQDFKDQLDTFVNSLTDVSSAFYRDNISGDYVYGQKAADEFYQTSVPSTSGNYEDSLFNLGLFSGSDVKTFKFNSEVINDLDQTDLDYLASVQWKDDVSFDKKSQNPNNSDAVSFSEFYQSIRVSVSSEKESADFVLTTQSEVRQSLEATYESIVRVDKDEEMTALIQFQAAYTASAKVITVVDEMLQTLLGIKR